MSEQSATQIVGITPDPWRTWRLAPDSDPERRLIVVTDDGETEICGIVYNEADADLIAAAPALLGACRSALRALEDNLQPGPMDGDAKEGLRSAIKLAEGRE